MKNLRLGSGFLIFLLFFMIMNGIGHTIGTLVTGRYFGGFAGGFTGLGLILIGLPLLYTLWKERPQAKSQQTSHQSIPADLEHNSTDVEVHAK